MGLRAPLTLTVPASVQGHAARMSEVGLQQHLLWLPRPTNWEKGWMMKKLLLTLLLVFSAANLTISITYAALCQGKGGARACGEQCTTISDGQCGCTGSCTQEELNWVAGAKAPAVTPPAN